MIARQWGNAATNLEVTDMQGSTGGNQGQNCARSNVESQWNLELILKLEDSRPENRREVRPFPPS